MMDFDAVFLQLGQQLQYPLQRIFKGRKLGQLAADVAVDTENPDVRQFGGALVQCRRLGDVHAELVVFQAGGNVGVGLGVHVRVHPNGDGRFPVQFAGYQIQQLQLRGGFHIETMNVGFQGCGHFIGGFAHAGKDNLVRIATGAQHPLQFAPGDDIEPRSTTSQYIQHRQVGVGFHRVTHLMRVVAEGFIEGQIMTLQSRTGIQVERRAEAIRQLLYGKFFGEQFTVAVLKGVHDYSCPDALASSSSWVSSLSVASACAAWALPADAAALRS